jgi:very-short-patch-repair endonuclease
VGDVFLTTPALAALAGRQHGVVSLAQLLAAGLSRRTIERWVQRGWLHRIHRGVYAVGHEGLTLRGRLWAAVLATGGVLSHQSAAGEWDLMRAPGGPVHVTVRGEGRSTKGIRVHRSRTLDPFKDVVHDEDGLPRTSVARTLVDLADVLAARQLERVCERAELMRLLDVVRLPGRRKLPVVTEPPLTRSRLERRFRALLARHDLPEPQSNAAVLGYEVDFYWPLARLIAAADGAGAHLTRTAFEGDRRRDAELMLAGYRVVRFTWRQVTGEPAYVAQTLQALL